MHALAHSPCPAIGTVNGTDFFQVSVVAGLEALRDAGIVTGEGEGGWMLPGHMRDTTGVMYASSYPALDAAIGEVRVGRLVG